MASLNIALQPSPIRILNNKKRKLIRNDKKEI